MPFQMRLFPLHLTHWWKSWISSLIADPSVSIQHNHGKECQTSRWCSTWGWRHRTQFPRCIKLLQCTRRRHSGRYIRVTWEFFTSAGFTQDFTIRKTTSQPCLHLVLDIFIDILWSNGSVLGWLYTWFWNAGECSPILTPVSMHTPNIQSYLMEFIFALLGFE